jgi:hypothetical protein
MGFVMIVPITILVLVKLVMEKVAVFQRVRKESESIYRVLAESVKMENLFPKIGGIVMLKDQLLAIIDKN